MRALERLASRRRFDEGGRSGAGKQASSEVCGERVVGVDGEQRVDGGLRGLVVGGVDQQLGAIAELALQNGKRGRVASGWLAGDRERALPAGVALLERLHAVRAPEWMRGKARKEGAGS